MKTKVYNKKNYVFLYQGLSIVRDALLEFLVASLKGYYGANWWKLGVEPAFRAEDIEKLKEQFQKRFSNPDGPSRPGVELYEILDLNYFGNIIEFNWKKVFAKILNNDRTLLAYIKEVVAYRNPVAHTETGDLRDDDTFRGLDTGDRLLRLINRDAADEIGKIKNGLRNAWVYEKMLGASIPEKVGVSIEKGFERLEAAVKEADLGSPDILFVENLRETLFSAIRIPRGQEDSDEVFQTNKLAYESVNKLSNQYLGVDFSEACILYTPLTKFTPKELSQKTLHIRRDIEDLEKEIKRFEIDLEIQKISDLDQRQFYLRQIERKKLLLNARQNDFEKIRNEFSAPVFFSVNRELDSTTVQEEAAFVVQVEVKNLGKNKTRVCYQEGLSPDLILLDGASGFETEVEPDSSYRFTYTCLCDKSGTHTLFSERLDYAEKISGWDIVKDTTILALPGKGPLLEGRRYFRFAQNGIDVILQLENFGDKIARSIHFQDTIVTKNQKRCELAFRGSLRPKERASASCTLDAYDFNDVLVPESSQIIFSDNMGKEYSLILNEPFSLLEYSFPSNPEFVGRQVEIEQVEKILKLIAGLVIEGQLYSERRVFLLEGVAGVGKTRFIREIQKIGYCPSSSLMDFFQQGEQRLDL